MSIHKHKFVILQLLANFFMRKRVIIHNCNDMKHVFTYVTHGV